MKIREIDHLVLYVHDIEKSLRFYHEVFDLPILDFENGRKALLCGKQKINLQTLTDLHQPVAKTPTIGSADLCLIAKDSIEDIEHHLKSYYVDIVAGPVERTGAHGKITSIYVRDPDGNLIEIGKY